MVNPETGAPHTAHTTNKVPFILAGRKEGGPAFAFADDKDRKEDEEEGALCDVAPTVLALLGLDKPKGACLFRVPFLAADVLRNDWPIAARCVSDIRAHIDVIKERKRTRGPRSGASLM